MLEIISNLRESSYGLRHLRWGSELQCSPMAGLLEPTDISHLVGEERGSSTPQLTGLEL